MSHFSTVKTELRDLQSLREALADLGHDARQGELQVNGYRGQTVVAQLAVSQANGSDIGFRWSAESGSYELVADLDLWQQPVPVERFLARLNQRYALRSILSASAAEGFQVAEQSNSVDGTIELVVTRWA
ncbi:MAG TPA: hypothetical protein DDY43_02450 [Synechococcales bacterium UBA10510]|nr:hypothetical protein [Synechococcales bacterium UBA10510]